MNYRRQVGSASKRTPPRACHRRASSPGTSPATAERRRISPLNARPCTPFPPKWWLESQLIDGENNPNACVDRKQKKVRARKKRELSGFVLKCRERRREWAFWACFGIGIYILNTERGGERERERKKEREIQRYRGVGLACG